MRGTETLDRRHGARLSADGWGWCYGGVGSQRWEHLKNEELRALLSNAKTISYTVDDSALRKGIPSADVKAAGGQLVESINRGNHFRYIAANKTQVSDVRLDIVFGAPNVTCKNNDMIDENAGTYTTLEMAVELTITDPKSGAVFELRGRDRSYESLTGHDTCSDGNWLLAKGIEAIGEKLRREMAPSETILAFTAPLAFEQGAA